MTDINNWRELITLVKVRSLDLNGKLQFINDYRIYNDYVQIPLNEYQILALQKTLKTIVPDGDWHEEILTILDVALQKLLL